MTFTLEQLLSGQPVAEQLRAEQIRGLATRSGCVRVVLDDDPTGTQSVSDLPVLLAWGEQDFEWAFSTNAPAVYVMTNSRSLAQTEAARRNRAVAVSALGAAQRVGKCVSFVSRSDSTLRGHFPLETNVLADVTIDETGHDVDGVLVVPAFGEAGRITVDSIHYASTPAGFIPVGESDFAADATFGYNSSDLRAWVEEKSRGETRASDVAAVTLSTLRQSHERVVDLLSRLSNRQACVVDIVDENDLRLLALAIYEVEAAGHRLLYRAGPPFVRALIGQEQRPALDVQQVGHALSAPRAAGVSARGGLIVIGSHVPLTTSQLAHLMAHAPRPHLELDVPTLIKPAAASYVEALADEAAEALSQGDVIVSTSRELLTAHDADASLALSRTVSEAVVSLVGGILRKRQPRFIIAKGGITSSDIALRGLHMERAEIVGSLLDGIISLWKPVSGAASGIPYVVFAGNVGNFSSLTDVVLKLTEALQRRDTEQQ